MSQEKVDRYKEAKKNRKEIMAKEKRASALRKMAGCIAGAALIAWIGVSGYNWYQASRPMETIYVDTTAIDDYMSGL